MLELEVERDRSAYEDDELLELDSMGLLCVRAEARRRGSDRVGRGGDMLLFDRVRDVEELSMEEVCDCCDERWLLCDSVKTFIAAWSERCDEPEGAFGSVEKGDSAEWSAYIMECERHCVMSVVLPADRRR